MTVPYPGDDYYPLDAAGEERRESPDDRIGRMVVDHLVRDAHLRVQPVTVSVQNRVVILEGVVDAAATAKAIGEAAWCTPGVLDVRNALRLSGRRPGSPA